MKKRVFSVLLACSMSLTAVSAPVVALADHYDVEIEQKQDEINELQNKQADLQAQIDQVEGKVASINGKAEKLIAKQTKLLAQTKKLQKEIADLKVRIERREKAIRNQARDVQVNGDNNNLVEAILNADSFTDAIVRIQAVSTIVNANNDLVAQQKADQKAVKAKKNETEKKIVKVQETKASLEAEKGNLQKSQADLAVLKADLALEQTTKESEKKAIQNRKEKAEAEAARIAEEERLAAQAQEQATQVETSQTQTQTTTTTSRPSSNTSSNVNTNNNTNSNTSSNQSSNSTNNYTPAPVKPKPTPAPAPSGNGSSVVAEAYKYIGVPYVWGGKTPSGFDCSGFTSYVYRQATGREIGGWTVPQESAGPKISVSEAQAGDLLFWGSPGSTYHVAIALGGGQYIHAPQPGQTVTVGSVSGFAPSFAVRM